MAGKQCAAGRRGHASLGSGTVEVYLAVWACQRRPLCPAIVPSLRDVFSAVMVELHVPVCARASWLRSRACAGRRVAGCLAPAVLLLCCAQGVRCHSPVSRSRAFQTFGAAGPAWSRWLPQLLGSQGARGSAQRQCYTCEGIKRERDIMRDGGPAQGRGVEWCAGLRGTQLPRRHAARRATRSHGRGACTVVGAH